MNRDRTADLLKGLAVIFMIQVHLVELFATTDIYMSWIGKISLFLGGPPAAPVFMVVMGYYFAMSKRTMKGGIIRGLKFILLGFLLNIGLNMHLFIRIANSSIVTSPWPYLFGVDILFLAGFSLIILSIVKHYFKLNLWPYIIILALVFVIQFFNSATDPKGLLDYFSAYFIGNNIWWSYFPLIPWLAYPTAGFIFYIIKNQVDVSYKNYRSYLVLFSGIITIIFISYGVNISAELSEYYHHGILFFLYTSCFLIFYAIGVEMITHMEGTWLSRWIEWLGIHVTAVYVIQWLLIGNIATAIYKTQGYGQLAFWFVVLLIVTSAGVLIWNRIKRFVNF